MPNHCENELLIVGYASAIDDFISQITVRDEEAIKQMESFYGDIHPVKILDNLYPCPEELKNVKANFLSPEEDDDEGKAKALNVKLYGHADWYSWCNDNWGTKWGDYEGRLTDSDYILTDYLKSNKLYTLDYDNGNKVILDPSVALDQQFKYAVIDFQSAWSPPSNGIQFISSVFRDINFYLYFSEPGMNFMGFDEYQNGECLGTDTVDMIETVDNRMGNLEWIVESRFGDE